MFSLYWCSHFTGVLILLVFSFYWCSYFIGVRTHLLALVVFCDDQGSGFAQATVCCPRALEEFFDGLSVLVPLDRVWFFRTVRG